MLICRDKRIIDVDKFLGFVGSAVVFEFTVNSLARAVARVNG